MLTDCVYGFQRVSLNSLYLQYWQMVWRMSSVAHKRAKHKCATEKIVLKKVETSKWMR